MSWPQVRLDSVAHINPRTKPIDGMSNNTAVSFVPMAAVSEESFSIVAEEERELGEVIKGYTSFQQGDVLIAKITPCFENGKLTIAHIRHQLGYGSTEFHVIRVFPDQLDPRYIYHYLRQDKIRSAGEKRMTGSAGQRRVPATFFQALQIPLPPLAEQQRIAAILDKADTLRAKRRTAVARLDALLQSTFLHLFGDPVTNPMGWEVGTIDLVVRQKSDIRCGPFGTQLKVDELVPEGIPLFGIENVHNNKFIPATSKFLTVQKAKQLSNFDVRNGDVLVTRMGTIGRACVVSGLVGEARISYHLFRVRPNSQKCLPQFLASTICRSGTFQQQLRLLSHGAIMSGLSTGNLRVVKFLLPPIEYQERYIKLVEKVEKHMKVQHTALEQLDNLFHALQQRAFKGEL